MLLKPVSHEIERTTLSKGTDTQGDANEIENHAHTYKLRVAEIMTLHQQHITIPFQVAKPLNRPYQSQDRQRA